jgi:hypothetical protein
LISPRFCMSASAVVGAVGASFELGKGIDPRDLAR